MKKFFIIFTGLILMGCSSKQQYKETYFYGTIDSLEKETCLVKATDEAIFQTQDLIDISSYFQSKDNVYHIDDFRVGENIYIGFDGVIQETLPIQLPNVFSIEKIKSQNYMNAIVEEVKEKDIVIRPCSTEEYDADSRLMEATTLLIPSEVISETKVPNLKKGDKIHIVFNEMKLEENPLKIMNVFSIDLCNEKNKEPAQ